MARDELCCIACLLTSFSLLRRIRCLSFFRFHSFLAKTRRFFERKQTGISLTHQKDWRKKATRDSHNQRFFETAPMDDPAL